MHMLIDFRLVIVCAKEDEQRSLLLGDLREYRRNPLPSCKVTELQVYLKSHFTCDIKLGSGVHNAGASVDPDE